MQAEEPGQSKEPKCPLEPGPAAWWAMMLCALAVGVIAGLGAVAFRAMIGGCHNFLFLSLWSFDYDANVHTPP
jgi:chloride channel protein, CIC family